jgi:hypothetical protein
MILTYNRAKWGCFMQRIHRHLTRSVLLLSIPGHSQRNAQWAWSSLLSNIRIPGCVWASTGPYLRCFTLPQCSCNHCPTTSCHTSYFFLHASKDQVEIHDLCIMFLSQDGEYCDYSLLECDIMKYGREV